MNTVILAVREIKVEKHTWQVAIFNFCDGCVTLNSAREIMKQFGYIDANLTCVQALLQANESLRPYLPIVCDAQSDNCAICIHKGEEGSIRVLSQTEGTWDDRYNFAGMKIAEGCKAWS